MTASDQHLTYPAAAKAPEALASLPPVEQRPTFIVHRLNAELARICNPLFRSLGVDLITSRILAVVAERERVHVGDIVELMALPQSTVSHQIKRLEGAGLLQRRPDANDHRTLIVELTTQGEALAQQCQAISARLFDTLFGDLSQAQMQSLNGALQTLDERLQHTRALS